MSRSVSGRYVRKQTEQSGSNYRQGCWFYECLLLNSFSSYLKPAESGRKKKGGARFFQGKCSSSACYHQLNSKLQAHSYTKPHGKSEKCDLHKLLRDQLRLGVLLLRKRKRGIREGSHKFNHFSVYLRVNYHWWPFTKERREQPLLVSSGWRTLLDLLILQMTQCCSLLWVFVAVFDSTLHCGSLIVSRTPPCGPEVSVWMTWRSLFFHVFKLKVFPYGRIFLPVSNIVNSLKSLLCEDT